MRHWLTVFLCELLAVLVPQAWGYAPESRLGGMVLAASSFDPVWNLADASGYSFCGGDPLNRFDADGRLAKGFFEGWKENNLSPADSSFGFDLGYVAGGVQRECLRGLLYGGAITVNTFSFGASDMLGLTDCSQYHGATYTGARIVSTIGRELLIAAATLGSVQLARAGSSIGYYGYQGLQVMNAGRSGYAIGTGIDQVSQGNEWGYVQIAGGSLGLAGAFTLTAVTPELNNLNVVQNRAFLTTVRELPSMDFSTPPNCAVFYSGPGNRQAALAFADATGAVPIDYTAGGAQLTKLNLYQGTVSAAQANFIWSAASRAYALQASGSINLFVEGARPSGIYSTVERPILQANPSVTQWMFHSAPTTAGAPVR